MISDLTGLTGLAILDAIVEGERDPRAEFLSSFGDDEGIYNLQSPQSRNHGVRASMQRQGVIMAICCGAVLFLGWNKLLTLIAIPAAMMPWATPASVSLRLA